MLRSPVFEVTVLGRGGDCSVKAVAAVRRGFALIPVLRWTTIGPAGVAPELLSMIALLGRKADDHVPCEPVVTTYVRRGRASSPPISPGIAG